MGVRAICILLLLAGAFSGCARVVVKKNPRPCDEGLRFYRPKPYLLVTPDSKGVSIALHYLPDYSEEYSIRMTPGINATTSFNPTLADGWNLTGFESSADQNVDDLISAVAEAIPKFKTNAVTGDDVGFSSVPFGFYEGVIGTDERGCRSLIGWRYVGILPMGGVAAEAQPKLVPENRDEQLWQLRLEEGQMRFSPAR